MVFVALRERSVARGYMKLHTEKLRKLRVESYMITGRTYAQTIVRVAGEKNAIRSLFRKL